MVRVFQIIQILLALVFIVLTLGFIGVEMEWSDGSRFKYSGWQFKKGGKENGSET